MSASSAQAVWVLLLEPSGTYVLARSLLHDSPHPPSAFCIEYSQFTAF